MSWVITGGNTYIPMDSSAASYITAVEAADGQALEPAVRCAIDQFVLGCKTDGIWTAIKASCILAGARTLSGALVPLVGAAPTNFNFVSGDYNRKTGLVGNGSTKYLDSNRNNNVDPVNSKHISVHMTTHHDRSVTRGVIGVPTFLGSSQLITTTTLRVFRANMGNLDGSSASPSDSSTDAGFWGVSRTASNSVTGRYKGASTVFSTASSEANSEMLQVFRRGTDYSNARLAFYSIGESLNLALLDARVTTLINAFAAVIP